MNKIITRIFISFIVMLIWPEINIKAQAFQASYINDASGNRVQATIIYLTANIKSEVIPLDTIIKKDTLAQVNSSNIPKDGWTNATIDSSTIQTITIYPNPTHGMLLIEISGVNVEKLNSTNNSIRVWDIQGKEILTITPVSYYNCIC